MTIPVAGGLRGVAVLTDMPVRSGTTVLVRVDLNVPIEGSRILDDSRIRRAVPTIRWLTSRGALVRLATHLGDPPAPGEPGRGLGPIPRRLAAMDLGDVTVLANLRADPREVTGDDEFVRELVSGCDLYVNDAFATAHRRHASILGPPRYAESAAGPLMCTEVGGIDDFFATGGPLVVVAGGAKIVDKLDVVISLRRHAHRILVGGSLVAPFLAASGRSDVAGVAAAEVARCRAALDAAPDLFELPSDIVVRKSDGTLRCTVGELDPAEEVVDIGPATAASYAAAVRTAARVFWNGPVGRFEEHGGAAGTDAIVAAMASAPGRTLVGGGHTVAAVRRAGAAEAIDHVSTGGGALLYYLAHGDLPGLQSLRGEDVAAPLVTAGAA